MSTQRDISPPSYDFKFQPCLSSLLFLNERYQSQIIQWGKDYKKILEQLEAEKQRLNALEANGTGVSPITWQQFDRQREETVIQQERKKNVGQEILDNIKFETGSLCGIMWTEIAADFTDKFINEAQYKEFLAGYQQAAVALKDNNLDYFTKHNSSAAITAAITKYLTIKN